MRRALQTLLRHRGDGAGVAALGLVAYRAFSDVAGKGVFLLITIVAAHRLSRQGFAVFSLASALGWIVAVATDGGMQLHVARAVSRQPHEAGAILRRWLRTRILAAAAALMIVAVGVRLAPGASVYAVPVVLFALVYIVNGLIEFLHYFYRGLERSEVESSLVLGQRLTVLACAMAVLLWRPDLTLLAAAMLAPAIVTFGVALWLAYGLSRDATRFERWREAAATDGAPASFRRDVFPIGLGIVLSALYFRVDLFLVQLWRGDEAVALYNAAFRLVEALRLFPAAALAVALPSLCRAETAAPVFRLSGALVAFGVAGAVVLWSTADWVVPLIYGAQYAQAASAFRILAWAFPLFALNYALTHQLIGWDGQTIYAWVCGAALAANLALDAWLIPARSIEGAAWATLLTETVVTGGCLVGIRSRLARRKTLASIASMASSHQAGPA